MDNENYIETTKMVLNACIRRLRVPKEKRKEFFIDLFYRISGQDIKKDDPLFEDTDMQKLIKG